VRWQVPYDLAGRLTQALDATGTYNFTYDNMDRLTQTTTDYAFDTAGAYAVGYSYDAASNRKTLTDPQNQGTTYIYDVLNRLQTLTSPQGSFGFSYDALSRRTQLTRPNGITTSYSYNPVSTLASVLHKNGRTTLDGDTYSYDNAGNRLSKTDNRTGTVSNYTYDAIYQLLTAKQGTNTTETYTYDLVGNRLSSLGVNPYNYNTSNELTSTPSVSYTYDNNGNTKTKSDGTTYTWDLENRLTQVQLPGSGGTVTFKYDPFGRRVQKSSSAGTTSYLYDGANVLEEVDNSGNVLARYTQGPGLDQPLSELRSGTTSYYQQDALSSVNSLSNSAGALVNTYTYDSYGKLTASTGTLTNPIQYTGREFDAETGIYEYRARFYDANTGRFLSEDPVGFGGGNNFYVYSSNNPALFTDPSGLNSQAGDLMNWLFGDFYANRYHSNDNVTSALSRSPVMDEIRNQYRNHHCKDGLYCGQFHFGQVFTTPSFVIQSVGSFCAYLTKVGDEVQVDAFNEWGFQSLTANPWGPRNGNSLWDMLVNGAPWGNPSSLGNNWSHGPMSRMRFWYHWTEKMPCCGN
jgi:RHS repeat-associated protein